tara:strand:- start:189 stop:575 length:387 start_codon:yes stop_codon:yes gene_type:complete
LTNRFADHYGGFLIVKGFCRSKVFVKRGVFSGAKFAVFTKIFLACFLARGGLQIPCQKNNIKLLKIYYNYSILYYIYYYSYLTYLALFGQPCLFGLISKVLLIWAKKKVPRLKGKAQHLDGRGGFYSP